MECGDSSPLFLTATSCGALERADESAREKAAASCRTPKIPLAPFRIAGSFTPTFEWRNRMNSEKRQIWTRAIFILLMATAVGLSVIPRAFADHHDVKKL